MPRGGGRGTANDASTRRSEGLWGPRCRARLPTNKPRFVKHTRRALLKDPDALNDSQLDVLDRLRREQSVLYCCWQLKEGLRDLYRLARPQDAGLHLDWWLAWACRCRIPAFVKLSKTIRANRGRILAAVELGLSNSKLEGLNTARFGSSTTAVMATTRLRP
jgi:transposase